jgi:uncharacterized metal-binding protein YceD (DUF177 family)
VSQRADSLDLESLNLPSGGGARLNIEVRVEPLRVGGEQYAVGPGSVDASVEVSRTTSGYAFRLRFEAPLSGPCMRCLSAARPVIEVDSREVEQPGEGEELHTPYLADGELELVGWARDALLLAIPARVLCREDGRGLCSVCGADLNVADPDEHRHERGGDPRWAKLKELKLD